MKRFLLIILLAFTLSPCYAYIEKNLKILSMESGMPDNTINRIYRDKNGFMWFATKKGISRYDGSNFKNFALPIKDQLVKNIFGSTENYIWTWGNGHLNCLNTESEKFMEIEFPNKEIIDKNKIYTSKVFNDSIVWLITRKSVFKTLVTTRSDHCKRSLSVMSKQLDIVDKNETITATDVDKDGNLYLSTTLNRIFVIDIENKTIKKFKLDLRKSLTHPSSSILHINVIGNSVWLDTSGQGVARFFIDTKVVQQFDDYPNTKLQIPHSNVFQTAKINNNQYIFVTWNGYNVITYDKTDRIPLSMKNYSNSYSDTHRSVECRIGSVYVDQDKVLWLGTFGSGVLVSNLNLQFYKQYHQDATNEVGSMAFDKDQHLWISTYHKGVFRSKKPFNIDSPLEFYLIKNNIFNGVNEDLPFITCDNQGRIWGGTAKDDIILYGENGIEKKINIKNIGSIRYMYFDKSDNLWICTSKGLFYLDNIFSGEAQQIRGTEKIITNSITEDQAGCLWISSVIGVLKYNPKTKEMIRYIDNLNANSILTTRDEIYIGTDIGLLAIGAKGDSTLLTTKDGLCGDDITTITEGCNGEIWISNDSGISRYSIADKTFHNYYIQSSNCSTARSEDGTLFFGNNKSITYFNPSVLSDFYHHISGRKITITELKIAGEIVSVGDTINGNVILDKPLEHTDKIVLNYKNNNFSLCVSNLLFNSVHQRCMYRMLPIQPNWTVINSSESISYMALPEGTYTFQVKDYSKGNNKTPVTELKIRIKSHWMFSLPTKIISALLLAIFVFMIFVRTRVRYKRQLYLSQLNSELKSQRVKLDRERKINRERINFFTYASHELRTPLTLIISPIQELLSDKKLMTHAKDKLLTIEQNAQSLLNITDKLLDFQQIDAKVTKLNISKIDILELLKTIISNFHSLCTENNIETTLTTTTDVPQLWLYADRQKIESAISNLISNSIKYRSPTEPKIEISVGVSNIDNIDFITVLIKDNGQGISDKAQKTIFESFSTDNNKPLLSTKIGIGLYIVRSIIELHHGTISLVSDIDKGTTFSVQIPQDYKYFDNDKSLSNLPNETIKKVDIKEKKTILIVEDNADILDYINSLFCNTYNVLTSNNGEDGLAIAKDKLPDIILQDVMLPGISGIECCSQLIHNSETSHIPIILLSAKADELSIMEGSMAGAADYIIKPFNPQILKAKVSSLISSRQMLKQIYAKTLMLNGESVHKVFENNFMQQLINITEQNLTNPEFSVELLAEKLNISTSTLRRNIKSYSDLPVNNIIRDVRLTKAASLIMTQKYRVVEIAEMVGYNDISSFRVQFTKKFGISPSKFHNT